MPPSSKFRAQFIHNQAAEWTDQYLEYDDLIVLLKEEVTACRVCGAGWASYVPGHRLRVGTPEAPGLRTLGPGMGTAPESRLAGA